MPHNALIIGGTSGIGLAVAHELAKICETVTVTGRHNPKNELPKNCFFRKVNLLTDEPDWQKEYPDIDILFYSAGFGRVAPFKEISEIEIENLFKINTLACFKVLNQYINRLSGQESFYCGVMASIAGRIASPLFSIYSATKAALTRGIEAINTELKITGSSNRILEVSPGYIKGTSFEGLPTDINKLQPLADEILKNLLERKTLYIPQWDEIYKGVVKRYNDDPEKFADDSYRYKEENGRMCGKSPIVVGYLSGTFDLFHIGHLNILKRAKEHCDFLVVGVHPDASHKGKETYIPLEERKEIIKSLKFVDKVIDAEKEDSDVYEKGIVKFDRLFVGSDYKGTPRFNRYEDLFKNKGVEIVYFPYTKGTSSTQLRAAIGN